MSDVWEAVVECRRRGEAAALATIVSTLGSTPGKDPMKMLVREDGTLVGSVGGGCLEAEVWEAAREVMRTLRSRTLEFTLTEEHYPDSGLICGGTVTVFIEPVTQPRVHVFGAGHVGAATARLAHEAGFRARVYDDRDDLLARAALPEGVERVGGAFEERAREALAGGCEFVIVVTRGHHDDERVLRCLAQVAPGEEAPRRPRFLGMIGSRAKRAVLLGRLERDGVPRAWLEAIVSPVGLAIGARTAPEIAVAIVAQLIQEVRGGGMGGEAGRRAAAQRAEPAAPEAPATPPALTRRTRRP